MESMFRDSMRSRATDAIRTEKDVKKRKSGLNRFRSNLEKVLHTHIALIILCVLVVLDASCVIGQILCDILIIQDKLKEADAAGHKLVELITHQYPAKFSPDNITSIEDVIHKLEEYPDIFSKYKSKSGSKYATDPYKALSLDPHKGTGGNSEYIASLTPLDGQTIPEQIGPQQAYPNVVAPNVPNAILASPGSGSGHGSGQHYPASATVQNVQLPEHSIQVGGSVHNPQSMVAMQDVPVNVQGQHLPTTGSTLYAPVDAPIQHVPASGSLQQAPVPGPAQYAPMTGPVQHAPPSGSLQQAPAPGLAQYDPAAGPVQHVPASGPLQQAPLPGLAQYAPAAGPIQHAPASGPLQQAPVPGLAQYAPATGPVQHSPAIGPVQHAQAPSPVLQAQVPASSHWNVVQAPQTNVYPNSYPTSNGAIAPPVARLAHITWETVHSVPGQPTGQNPPGGYPQTGQASIPVLGAPVKKRSTRSEAYMRILEELIAAESELTSRRVRRAADAAEDAHGDEGGHGGGHSLLEELTHIFHLGSMAILSFLMLETLLKVFAMGRKCLHHKLEMFDAFVVTVSWSLDIAFAQGIWYFPGTDAATILLFLLPWRVVRIVNSFVMVIEERGHVKLKLTKQKLRTADKKLTGHKLSIERYRMEIRSLQGLCRKHRAKEEEIEACAPNWKRRRSSLVSMMEGCAKLALASAIGGEAELGGNNTDDSNSDSSSDNGSIPPQPRTHAPRRIRSTDSGVSSVSMNSKFGDSPCGGRDNTVFTLDEFPSRYPSRHNSSRRSRRSSTGSYVDQDIL